MVGGTSRSIVKCCVPPRKDDDCDPAGGADGRDDESDDDATTCIAHTPPRAVETGESARDPTRSTDDVDTSITERAMYSTHSPTKKANVGHPQLAAEPAPSAMARRAQRERG